jgi:RNA polymerase-binding transcription factor DksA
MGKLSTYWSPTQYQQFESVLNEQRRLLTLELQAALLTDRAIDREITRLRMDLKAAEQALDRLRRGVFGICTDCGEDIDAPQLRTWAAASRCGSCEHRSDMITV